MKMDIEIVRADRADAELVNAFAELIPQLSSSTPGPTRELLAEIVGSPCNTLLIARDRADGNRILGTLTLVVFRIPTGVRAWIEDVVVSGSMQGKGIGEKLTLEALDIAAAKGARTVELTSRPSREAANRLYTRLGFVKRETNVYRHTAQLR